MVSEGKSRSEEKSAMRVKIVDASLGKRPRPRPASTHTAHSEHVGTSDDNVHNGETRAGGCKVEGKGERNANGGIREIVVEGGKLDAHG